MIRMEKHVGINVIGQIQDVGQWRVFEGEKLLGYLPYLENSQFMPVHQFPYERTDEIVAEMERLRNEMGSPSKVIPPMTSLRDIEAAIAILREQERQEEDAADASE
jgi:hypothetical protein